MSYRKIRSFNTLTNRVCYLRLNFGFFFFTPLVRKIDPRVVIDFVFTDRLLPTWSAGNDAHPWDLVVLPNLTLPNLKRAAVLSRAKLPKKKQIYENAQRPATVFACAYETGRLESENLRNEKHKTGTKHPTDRIHVTRALCFENRRQRPDWRTRRHFRQDDRIVENYVNRFFTIHLLPIRF